MSKEKEGIIFRVISIGDSGVGKTAINKRYVYNTFSTDSLSTIGLNFSFKDVILKNGTKVQLKLIDTAGQEKYKGMTKSYYKNAEGVLFVFAFNDKKSFENIGEWMKTFKDNNSKEGIPSYLIGNKCDLTTGVEVTKEMIDEFIKKNNIEKYMPTSASANTNIDIVFQDMAEIMYEDYKKSEGVVQGAHKLYKYKKKSKGCCLADP